VTPLFTNSRNWSIRRLKCQFCVFFTNKSDYLPTNQLAPSVVNWRNSANFATDLVLIALPALTNYLFAEIKGPCS
jgi:hypothetical protein